MDRPTDLLFARDAYARTCEAVVVEVDERTGRVALDRTVFYPGGGGQPADRGRLGWGDGDTAVVGVGSADGLVWHELDGGHLPAPGEPVHAELDWERRHVLMRTHTALHVLCGVVYAEFGVPVTGGNMTPGEGRLDFPLDAATAELGRRLEQRINDEVERAREVLVDVVDRAAAARDPALIRTRADLIPAHVDPLRVIDIVGLDRQADGGTHVASTLEVGRVEVTRTESKGRDNKRVRLRLHPAAASGEATPVR